MKNLRKRYERICKIQKVCHVIGSIGALIVFFNLLGLAGGIEHDTVTTALAIKTILVNSVLAGISGLLCAM